MGKITEPIETRFWWYVDIKSENECWNWTYTKNVAGYGIIRPFSGSPMRLAHRIVWKLTHGKLAKDICVLHKCDNRLCCNPKHLFLGTRADNVYDMIKKKRHIPPTHEFGEASANHKLTQEIVDNIRFYVRNGMKQKDVAIKFGLSKAHICRLVHGIRWPLK